MEGGDGRLPIANCQLPIADCRLPIADCRLLINFKKPGFLTSSTCGLSAGTLIDKARLFNEICLRFLGWGAGACSAVPGRF
jgi:hypothetical protein